MTIESAEEAFALHALGWLKSDDLPDLAVSLMAQGIDSPSVAVLAGATRADSPRDRWDLFDDVRHELRQGIPDKLSAARALKKIYARRGARSANDARDAARRIVGLYHVVYELLPTSTSGLAGEEFGIHSLLGTYYAYDDIPFDDATTAKQLDAELIELCRELADREGA